MEWLLDDFELKFNEIFLDGAALLIFTDKDTFICVWGTNTPKNHQKPDLFYKQNKLNDGYDLIVSILD